MYFRLQSKYQLTISPRPRCRDFKPYSEDELKVTLTISGLVDLTVEAFTVVTKKA